MVNLYWNGIKLLAEKLLEKETISGDELRYIINRQYVLRPEKIAYKIKTT